MNVPISCSHTDGGLISGDASNFSIYIDCFLLTDTTNIVMGEWIQLGTHT